MPSAFTHALVGGATAALLPADLPRWRVAVALGVAAAAPDLDVVAFAAGIPYEHVLGHRGLSHSLAVAIAVGAAAAVVSTWDGKLIRENLLRLVVVGFAAVASHGLLDAATDAGMGVGLLLPWSERRFFFPFRPIETAPVDPLRFFSDRGATVLWSEIVWVWLPIGVVALVSRVREVVGSQKGSPLPPRAP